MDGRDGLKEIRLPDFITVLRISFVFIAAGCFELNNASVIFLLLIQNIVMAISFYFNISLKNEIIFICRPLASYLIYTSFQIWFLLYQ